MAYQYARQTKEPKAERDGCTITMGTETLLPLQKCGKGRPRRSALRTRGSRRRNVITAFNARHERRVVSLPRIGMIDALGHRRIEDPWRAAFPWHHMGDAI